MHYCIADDERQLAGGNGTIRAFLLSRRHTHLVLFVVLLLRERLIIAFVTVDISACIQVLRHDATMSDLAMENGAPTTFIVIAVLVIANYCERLSFRNGRYPRHGLYQRYICGRLVAHHLQGVLQ